MKIAGKMQVFVALVLLGMGFVVAGCKSAPELTKDQALKLIQAKYDAMTPGKIDIAIPDRGMQQAVTAGYVTGLKRYPNGYWADFKVAPAGAKLFTLASKGDTIEWRPTQPNDPQYAITVTTVAELKRKARDVSDPTDFANGKMATFTEEVVLAPLPLPLQEMARNPGNFVVQKKTAHFALTDGAWTLTSLD